jgi:hypothetical protein
MRRSVFLAVALRQGLVVLRLKSFGVTIKSVEKYPQTKADEQPQAKTEGQKPPYVWRPIFAGAFQELLSHSWLQNLLIGLALLLIWPLIGATFMNSRKAIIIGFGIGLTILIWIGVIILVRQAVLEREPSPKPVVPLSPSPSPLLSPETPRNIPTPESKPIKIVGGGPSQPRPNTSPPYYADLNAPKWTDYREDYFGGAIWRWGYRPEMPGQTPRNIGGYCPDCGCALRATNLLYPDPNGPGDRYLFDCPLNDHRFFIPAVSHDPYEGVKRLIQEKLKDRDYWEAVVIRQREARKGRRI